MGQKRSQNKQQNKNTRIRTHISYLKRLSQKQVACLYKIGRLVTALWNSGIQYSQEHWTLTGYYPNGYDLQKALKQTPQYRAVNNDIANATLDRVAEAYQNAIYHSAGTPKPKHPNQPSTIQLNCNRKYITTEHDYVLIPGTQWRLQDGETPEQKQKRRKKYEEEILLRRLPRPDIPDEELDSATGFQVVFHKGGAISLNIQRHVQGKEPKAEPTGKETRIMGIDLGIDNLATCTSVDIGIGTEAILDCFIIDGKALKSWNKRYNAHKAELQEAASIVMDDELDHHRFTRKNRLWGIIRLLGDKRERQVDWFLRTAAARVADRARAYGVQLVCCGWNDGFKQRLDMGRVGNQRFACVPLARFRDFLMVACMSRGVSFVTVEEAFTSKASFLNLDPLPSFGDVRSGRVERPKFSGIRVKRGLYRTTVNGRTCELNADVNACLNILRKCKLGALERVSACLGATGVLAAVSRPERVMIVVKGKVNTESKTQDCKPRIKPQRFEFSWTSKAMHSRTMMYNPNKEKAPTS